MVLYLRDLFAYLGKPGETGGGAHTPTPTMVFSSLAFWKAVPQFSPKIAYPQPFHIAS